LLISPPPLGLFTGSLYMGAHWLLTGGKEPFTLHHHKPDHECLQPASSSTPIDYPKPDGKLSFDLLTNLARSGTNHNEVFVCFFRGRGGGGGGHFLILEICSSSPLPLSSSSLLLPPLP